MRRPLSMAQQAMLAADQLRPGMLSDKTTLTIALRVRGPLDLDRLAAAYDQLVSRHEILRSRLVPAATQRGEVDHAEVWPHQRVLPELASQRESTDTDEQFFARWDGLPIDPQRPPLVRCFIVRRQSDEHLIGLVFSHIVADPTGVRIAVRELADLYNAHDAATRRPLPPAAQYSAYAAWEAERFQARGEADRAAWRRILQGVEPARYQRSVAFVAGRRAAPALTTFPVFNKHESDAIARWSWRHRSTLSITLLAAFARALREDADRDDLLVSTLFEQRDHPAARDMLGIFLKGAPVRLRVSEREPMAALVLRARSVVLEAYQRAQLPLLDYVKLMPRFVPGALGLAPTWVRFFQYVPAERSAYSFGDASATVAHLGGRGDPKDMLGIHLGIFHGEDGSLHGRYSYDTHEFDAQHARRLVDDFRDYTLEAVS